MLGSSIDGTEETLLCPCGRCGDVGEPGGEIVSSSMERLSSSESSEYSTSDDGIQTLKPLLECDTVEAADGID